MVKVYHKGKKYNFSSLGLMLEFVKNNEYSFTFSFVKESIQILEKIFVAGIKCYFP